MSLLFICLLFLFEIFFHQSLGFIQLARWGFLCLLLESIEKNNEIPFVKATEDTVYVGVVFNPDFVLTLSSLNRLQKPDWNFLYHHDKGDHLIKLLQCLPVQGFPKLSKVVFKYHNPPDEFLFHGAKLTN